MIFLTVVILNTLLQANPVSNETDASTIGNLCTADHVPIFYSQGKLIHAN